MALLEFCQYTRVSRVCTLEATCYPFDSLPENIVLNSYWRRLEEKYTSYTFSTSALDGGEWSASRPGRVLAPGKGPSVPIVQEAG
jgi:hypothetical protein